MTRSSNEAEWYGVRCLFGWGEKPNGEPQTFEERITIWKAGSADEAIAQAEKEAAEYAAENSLSYLGLAQSYRIAGDGPTEGCEVFSLLRDSDLPPADYMDQFFDTGTEHQQHA